MARFPENHQSGSFPTLASFVAAVLDRHAHVRTKRHSLRLGPVMLPSKAAAQDLIRSILHTAPIERKLPGTFTPLLLGLLQWHPNCAEKLQYGCRGFFVRVNPPAFKAKDRGFYIITERPPPTVVSFSIIRCFAATDSTPWQRLNQAARAAIVPAILDFKNRQFVSGALCPRGCGNRLTAENVQVDHVAPKFRAIVSEFRTRFGTRQLDHRATYGWRFTDPDDELAFVGFHNNQAVLELVCAQCNMAAERLP